MSGRIEFAMNFGVGQGRRRHSENGGRIYLIGNFSGASRVDGGQPGFVRIDRDNVDEVMAKLKPSVAIQPGMLLQFSAIEDFHPDAWLDKVKVIADLLQLKRQLQNPATAAQAAAQIRALLPAAPAEQPAPSPGAAIDDQTWLHLLGKVPQDAQQSDPLSQWLQQTVSPHAVQPVSPQQQDLLQLADLLLAQFCRIVLHHAGFQHLEALWRATLALLQEEQAEQYSLFLLDMDKSALHRALAEPAAGFAERLQGHIATGDGEGEVLLVADLLFEAGDTQLLSHCRDLARQCGARLIAGVDAGFCRQRLDAAGKSAAIDDDLWLAYPRYLARLPYAPKIDPIDGFDFVEVAEPPAAADLLWANAAFLLARAAMRGEADDAGFFGDVAVFSYSRHGEPVLQAGAETVLNEAQAHALLACGIVPLIGFHQRQGVRLLV